MVTKKEEIRPSRKWYLVALLTFIIGITAGIVILITVIASSLVDGKRFVVPGSITLSVKSPCKYTLWNETSTVFKGKTYSSSPELPAGLEIRISDVLTEKNIELSPSYGGKETSGPGEKYSIGNVHFDRPGEYKIEVKGNFPERVFFLRPSIFRSVLTGVLLSFLLGVIGGVGAPALAIIVYIKRENARKRILGPFPESSDVQKKTVIITSMDEKQERMWAMFCHLGTFLGYLIPFANIITPLIIWLMKKDESSLIDDQGKESLNFQISIMIYYIISLLLTLLIIGVLFLIGLVVFNLVVVIIAGIKANNGERYRYPITIRFIK